ncbi:hypothetical protein M9Y10_003092 [Tritrichomonas musculus]|uniref:alpha-galactosidase n=1 Tax=Tritrichomonas musculus TaxID=1915356 RepID=A0ABR2JNX2_9EUKA
MTSAVVHYHEGCKTFHLTNGRISYIMKILLNDHVGQLYYGKALIDVDNFDHLLENYSRGMQTSVFQDNKFFSLEHMKQEYPCYGSTDFRGPAYQIKQPNGSLITDLAYQSHTITKGKPKLEGLPATYVENENEAVTLTLHLHDKLLGLDVNLNYTLFSDYDAIARSVQFINNGTQELRILSAMSLCVDLPDSNYNFVHFDGAWARERHLHEGKLQQGIQAVGSRRGHSSPNHNPFIMLRRPNTDEYSGEVLGFSLVYSGNFIAQVEVDTWNTSRVTLGINPINFDWKLSPKATFQTPEAVVVYSSEGTNGLSRNFHHLYRTRLVRGQWRDKPRPILINNWEATYFDFNEDKLVSIAEAAKNDGVELFVLDDGWFGARCSDTAGLGDWKPNLDRLPRGIKGLSERIEALGMKFGLWFEPEMVNMDSDLFRAHPDWRISTPDRRISQGRNQYVLDFSRKEVVDNIYEQMSTLLADSKVSYIKWDMNRSMTEVFSAGFPADQQGEIFHRYILGVYNLYERLIQKFPHILFESCSSGGARFDPGLLYYAPQCWASDNTDAVCRMKIQYGTSFCYPISAMGAHVSACPNHQNSRTTPFQTRANVAHFGTFGYELDLNKLTQEERQMVRDQIKFMKEYREIIQFGEFYRLVSPFEGNFMSWMVVSKDKKTAIVGWYKVLNDVNAAYQRVHLLGLDPSLVYKVDGDKGHTGSELMNHGLIVSDSEAGHEAPYEYRHSCDFDSRLFVLKA